MSDEYYYDEEDYLAGGDYEEDGSGAGFKESDFIPLDDLVYAPLHALAKSNQQLRAQVVDAIKSMGTLRQNGAEETVRLNNINIAYEQVRPEGDEGYSVDNLQMQVPLLSIVPITNLNVEKAEIDFSTEVKAEKGEEGKCAITARICSPEQRESDFLPRVSYKMKISSIPATEGMRKPFMNIALILGMFPGFMSMIAVYYILKGLGFLETGVLKQVALVMVYSGGAGLGFYMAKGFFDTIPKTIDEAAYIDGATKWDTFIHVTIPMSKPIITYTLLTTFMGPWVDYIFAKVIMGNDTKYYTIAIGLWTMLEKEYIETFYTQFYAGCVLISIPIAILFLLTQKYYVEGLSGAVKG